MTRFFVFQAQSEIIQKVLQRFGSRSINGDSLWGHMAGAGLNAADSKFIDDEIKSLLAA
jgi:hypothetical protein